MSVKHLFKPGSRRKKRLEAAADLCVENPASVLPSVVLLWFIWHNPIKAARYVNKLNQQQAKIAG